MTKRLLHVKMHIGNLKSPVCRAARQGIQEIRLDTLPTAAHRRHGGPGWYWHRCWASAAESAGDCGTNLPIDDFFPKKIVYVGIY